MQYCTTILGCMRPGTAQNSVIANLQTDIQIEPCFR